jgi:Glycosyl transferase family 2
MKIACLMMQKNEDLLLEPWILYHARLFGIRNLFVFDNGSAPGVASDVLTRYEKLGLNVNRAFNTANDFDRKGEIIGNLIREFGRANTYESVFPLDCDEFVAVDSDAGISCRREPILSCLESLGGRPVVAQIGYCLDNRPGFLDLFRLVPFEKAFLPVATFAEIDHGFHQPRTLAGEPPVASPIRLIHMHFKPFDLVRRHARDKLAPFVNVDDAAAVAAFQGVGTHLVRYFAMSQDEYYSDFGLYEYPLVSFTGLLDQLRELMPIEPFQAQWCARPAWLNRATAGRDIVELPGEYFGPEYLKANPDVARSSIDPTTHYCLFGHRERRSLRL